MLLVLPFHHRDKLQAIRLAEWIKTLGGVKNHECLLVHDVGTDTNGILQPLQEAFKEVTLNIVQNVPVANWAEGKGDASACNEMWINTAWFIYYRWKHHWLWCEPDACPQYPAWMDDIDRDHLASGKPFSGARIKISDGSERLSGNAVYPKNVCDFSITALTAQKVPWDVAGASDIIKHANFSELFQHVPSPLGQSPTFPDAESLRLISPKTALFHPCKDGSLIDRLRERMSPAILPIVAAEMHKKPEILTIAPQKSQRETVLEGIVGELRAEIASLKRIVTGRTAPAKERRRRPSKRKPMSAEHKAKLVVALANARAAKAKKA